MVRDSGVMVLTSPLVAGPLILAMLSATGILAYRQSRLDGIPDIGDPFDVEAIAAVDVDSTDNALSDLRNCVLAAGQPL